MKLSTPVYFLLGTVLCLYLGLASRNGWSLVRTLTPRALLPSASSLQHK
ncbi:MAG: hypothetical protein J0L84_10935 [Verrucomicrobia bacterium]|nr:hypothetical protein [Verrucomicrobiota bacterium]